jgi:hypothetical protein
MTVALAASSLHILLKPCRHPMTQINPQAAPPRLIDVKEQELRSFYGFRS